MQVAARSLPRRLVLSRRTRARWFAVGAITPAFVVVLFVVGFPLLYALYLSFTDYNLLQAGSRAYVGFENYRELWSDSVFQRSLINTIAFVAIAVNVELVLGLAISQLMARAARNLGVLRTLVMMPMMFAPVLIGFQFKWFFNDQIGLVNNAVSSVRGKTTVIPWLVEFPHDMFALLAAEIWMGTPFMVIVLLAGTLSLPQEAFEAAAVDGARPWQRLRYVTLPLLTPYIYIALAIRSLDVSRAYDIVRIMTDGGPAHRTEMIWTYIFRVSITNGDFGFGAAMSFVTVVVSVVFTLYFFVQLVRYRRRMVL